MRFLLVAIFIGFVNISNGDVIINNNSISNKVDYSENIFGKKLDQLLNVNKKKTKTNSIIGNQLKKPKPILSNNDPHALIIWDVEHSKHGKAKSISYDDSIKSLDLILNGAFYTKNGMEGYFWSIFEKPLLFQYYLFEFDTGEIEYAITDIQMDMTFGGVDKWELRTSVDNYANPIGELFIASDGNYTMHIDNFSTIGNTKFKLYGHSNDNRFEPAGISGNVSMFGHVIPEPSTINLIAISGIFVFFVKKHFMNY